MGTIAVDVAVPDALRPVVDVAALPAALGGAGSVWLVLSERGTAGAVDADDR
ncbi:hypothetical protein AB0467_08265 [Streptomyces sp. NPDC052095]|uniref:hypothetical protein n=1 Tax=unclassified Streptomyces TaxID=2593676 RepID=UPI00344F1E78